MHNCVFCEIAAGRQPAEVVYEDAQCIAFLDIKPLFHGHVLLIPKAHVETLDDLPAELIAPFFIISQKLSKAIKAAMEAEGTFVAMNNRVSQSVPHLHVHIVPRKKGDGLKGFFWPRTKYQSADQMAGVRETIKSALLGIEK